ncbi:cholesterol oxidase substrate-binding domain-containing protein [Streptomyces armeniacus]|uniref:cholesterol oxidase substrate-binding domain-containing protein n=1 Tax=Streptomyces armeniacus TaxID=83291 RepID=UPI001AD81D53
MEQQVEAALPGAGDVAVEGHRGAGGDLAHLTGSFVLFGVSWRGRSPHPFLDIRHRRSSERLRADPGKAARIGRRTDAHGAGVPADGQAGEEVPPRCESRVDISADELFAASGSAAAARGRTLSDFMAETGRAEAIRFAFTDRPRVKVWSLSPARPAVRGRSRGRTTTRSATRCRTPVSRLLGRLVGDGAWYPAPAFGAAQYTVAATGRLPARVTAVRSGAGQAAIGGDRLDPGRSGTRPKAPTGVGAFGPGRTGSARAAHGSHVTGR